jgi:hypothetical protein
MEDTPEKPNDEEIARRMERGIRRFLNTPPEPHGKNPKSPHPPKPKVQRPKKASPHKLGNN